MILKTAHFLYYNVYINSSTEIKERYGDSTKLAHEMSGSFYEIFSRVMKVLVGKKVTIPGAFKRYKLVRLLSFCCSFLFSFFFY